MKTLCCHTQKISKVEHKAVCANESCFNYLGETKLIHQFDAGKIAVVGVVFFFFLVFTLEDYSMNKKPSMMTYKNNASPAFEPLTIYNLKTEIEKQKIICPDAVLAQMRLESGNFTSTILKRTNNMLGMRYPFNRETKACGIYLVECDTIIYGATGDLKKLAKTNDNYSVYENWKDAVADYKLWQKNIFKVEERYLNFLGNVYAEDSLYVRKIKQLVID